MTTEPLQTYTFYDLETFGTDTQRDRIVQFAAIRTDSNFNQLESTVLYCRPPRDYLPSVEAIMVTGISPAFADRNGLKENDFMRSVLEFLTRPNNCVLGYNSIRFDDEFIRHSAFRNFFPAYRYNTDQGSSRWDILPLIRLCAALCPEGINFPVIESENRFDLRLSSLSQANNLPHTHAHDALSDVEATIALTRLIREKQPQMFNYVFNHRSRLSLTNLLSDPHTGALLQRPMAVINSRFGVEHMFTGVVLPVCFDKYKSSIYCWDLTLPRDSFRDLPSSQELDCSAVKLQDLGIVKIKLTACPIIVPVNVLNRNGRAERVNIDMNLVEDNLRMLREQNLMENLLAEYDAKYTEYYKSSSPRRDPDLGLYFLSYENNRDKFQDSAAMEKLHIQEQMNPQILNNTEFTQDLLNELLFLYKARNFEEILNEEEKIKWNQRISNYGSEHGSEFMQSLSDCCSTYEKDPQKMELLREIATFYGISG